MFLLENRMKMATEKLEKEAELVPKKRDTTEEAR
jgi:hypothetical protein